MMVRHDESDAGGPLEGREDGVRLRVRAQPRASRTELAGPYGDALRIRLAAPPVDGAANEELVKFLARRLGVPRSSVDVVAGTSGRDKTVMIAGVSMADARRKLDLP